MTQAEDVINKHKIKFGYFPGVQWKCIKRWEEK